MPSLSHDDVCLPIEKKKDADNAYLGMYSVVYLPRYIAI